MESASPLVNQDYTSCPNSVIVVVVSNFFPRMHTYVCPDRSTAVVSSTVRWFERSLDMGTTALYILGREGPQVFNISFLS